MRKRGARDSDRPVVVAPEQVAIAALSDLDEITGWLGTFRVRLAASRDAERSGVASVVSRLETRYRERRAELA